MDSYPQAYASGTDRESSEFILLFHETLGFIDVFHPWS